MKWLDPKLFFSGEGVKTKIILTVCQNRRSNYIFVLHGLFTSSVNLQVRMYNLFDASSGTNSTKSMANFIPSATDNCGKVTPWNGKTLKNTNEKIYINQDPQIKIY